MKINRLSVLRTSCLWDLLEHAHSDTKKDFEQFLTRYFHEFLFSCCWQKQTIGRDCLSFDRVYTSVHVFSWITENQQVHCIHYHLLKSPCFPYWHFISVAFLDKVKNCLLVKKQNQYSCQYCCCWFNWLSIFVDWC